MRCTLFGHALGASAILLRALKVLTKYILCYSAATNDPADRREVVFEAIEPRSQGVAATF
jgi:hypothetical protein